jgi:hypothetical protein
MHSRTLKLLVVLVGAALLATAPFWAPGLWAQVTQAAGGGGAKTLEQVTNPGGNVDVNQVTNPGGVKDLSTVMDPSVAKTPDQLAKPTKSLDEVTKDATVDVDAVTEPTADH